MGDCEVGWWSRDREAAAFWSSAVARAAEPILQQHGRGQAGARRFGSALCARDRGHAQRL